MQFCSDWECFYSPGLLGSYLDFRQRCQTCCSQGMLMLALSRVSHRRSSLLSFLFPAIFILFHCLPMIVHANKFRLPSEFQTKALNLHAEPSRAALTVVMWHELRVCMKYSMEISWLLTFLSASYTKPALGMSPPKRLSNLEM
jgi:hypothetical protein